MIALLFTEQVGSLLLHIFAMNREFIQNSLDLNYLVTHEPQHYGILISVTISFSFKRDNLIVVFLEKLIQLFPFRLHHWLTTHGLS